MAYALRYYKELIHEDGSAHRLEIHKKDSTAEAVEIGAVIQGLALEIQGSQGDVDSPIVKTSLSMTFVDAGDIEDGRKNGFWQEFYTPDALLWKVILKARTATETSFRTIWGGYVTPDSFSESLVYRGSVNIIARDNIGHMQDFPFDAVGDADGLISLRNLVEAGWEKIQSPMVLDWRGESESTMWLMCDGVPAPDTLMNVSQFEGMDWYKAIETALASYGIVMRWVGDNIVCISSLRSMPLQGREVYDNLSQITPVFVAGAQRELVPAVRRIEESVDYDIQEEQCDPIETSDFTGDIEYYNIQGNSAEKEGIAWAVTKKESGYGWCAPEYSMFFNPRAYTFFNDNDADAKYMWLCANVYEIDSLFSLRYAECSRFIYNASNVVFNVKFGSPYFFAIGGFLNTGNDFLKRCVLSVKIVKDGVAYYLDENGEWGEVKSKFSVDIQGDMLNLPIDFGTLAGSLLLCVQIQHLFTDRETYARYVPVYSTTISQGLPVLEKNTVNTAYNAENNVVLSRTPEIGPAYDAVALPGLIKNGIFYRSEGVVLPARAWGWSGSTPQQMAVYNHLQLLCYYAKPNNLISGTIVNGDLTGGSAIYLWHGKEHLLVSGRYNLLNGMIEGAMLREFTRYEDMWGEVSETAFPDTEQDSTTNVEGGSSSGGSSSTYTNTTTVNIGSGGGGGASYLNDLLDVNTDSITAQSVLYYNGTEWVGRSLSAILNGYAKSADLLTLSDLLASMWSIDADGNLVTDKQVIIKNNLIVYGDTASGGTGGGAAIGVTGILVDGKQYTDNDSDGYIDLSEAFAGLSPTITSVMITEALGYTPANSASLGSLAYKNGLTASDIPDLSGTYLSKAGGTINGIITITHDSWRYGYIDFVDNRIGSGGYSDAIIRIVDANGDRHGALGLYGGTSGIEYFYIGHNNYNENNLRVYKDKVAFGGSTILHAGNYSDYALPITGGTITSASSPLTINRTSNNPVISYQANGTLVGVLGFDTRGLLIVRPNYTTNSNYYNVLHSGNIGSYKSGDSDKLGGNSLSWVQDNGRKFSRVKDATSSNVADANADLIGGGMIYSYSNTKGAIVNGPSGMQYGHIWEIGSYGSDALNGQLAWDINHNSTEDVTRKLWWRARDSVNGWTYAKWHQIAFTDSDITGSANALTEEVLTDLNNATSCRIFTMTSGYNSTEGNKPTTDWVTGITFRVAANDNYRSQLAIGGNSRLYFRRENNGTWAAWKEIAFLTDNVASATKLADNTAFTAWGQTFFENGKPKNVSGALKTPSGYNAVTILDSYLVLGQGMAENSLPTYLDGYNVYMRYGKSSTIGLTLNSSGNVLIGTTNDAGSKLYVNGDGRFEGALASGGPLTVGGALTASAGATITGDVRINGNLVVTGDIASA